MRISYLSNLKKSFPDIAESRNRLLLFFVTAPTLHPPAPNYFLYQLRCTVVIVSFSIYSIYSPYSTHTVETFPTFTSSLQQSKVQVRANTNRRASHKSSRRTSSLTSTYVAPGRNVRFTCNTVTLRLRSLSGDEVSC